MTSSNATAATATVIAVTAAFIAVFGMGVWTGPHITHRWETSQSAAVPAPEAQATTPSVLTKPAGAALASPKSAARREEPTRAVGNTLSPSAPEVQKLLKPVLNSGTNMKVAAEGFQSAEQFAAVAHAAKNTDVPFMVLKHRVLTERKPLSTAIRESKPDINVAAEASLARAEAKKDLASIGA